MGLFGIFTQLLAAFSVEISGPMLFALHRGDARQAFERYLGEVKEEKCHDYALLQQAARTLLEEGADSKDPEVRLLSMFGAGVAASSELLPLLEKGMRSDDVRTQLVCLSYLGRLQDDDADLLLLDCLSSPYVIVRLEALLQLAQKNHPAALSHLTSLAVKMQGPLRASLAQIAIHLEGAEGTRFLHKLLSDIEPSVRVETILNLAKARRDDFLPSLHTLACGSSLAEQEAIAVAFGELKDESAIPRLKEMAGSKQELLRLAASFSLYNLGEKSYLETIENDAAKGSLYAIAALGKLKKGRKTLLALMEKTDRDIKLNAMIALLTLREKTILPHLKEVLVADGRNLGYWKQSSLSGALKVWRTIPSASQQSKQYPGLENHTIALREALLSGCLEFEEPEVLDLARHLMRNRQYVLVPLLMDLLENKRSPEVIAFLKEEQQRAGAPLVRNYCTLSLYRLKEKGPYEELLMNWIKTHGCDEMIRFRDTEDPSPSLCAPHALTPEETSRFLIDACEALSSAQNLGGLETLVHACAYGNPKNRYALAGLLLRTTE